MIRTTGHGRPALCLARLAAALLALTLTSATAATAAAAIPAKLTEVPKQRFLTATGNGSVSAVAGRCDLDDDGTPDLLVGLSGLNPSGGTLAPGGAYVVFGGGTDLSQRLVLVGDLGKAAESPQTGASVACAGDVNGDDVDDLLVGAPVFAPAGSPDARHGAVYVIFGGSDLRAQPTIQLGSLGSRGFRIDGVSYGGNVSTRLGSSVAGVGDVDGDGKDDIAVGTTWWRTGPSPAPASIGGVLVVAGRSTTTNVDLADPASTLLRVTGTAASDQVDGIAPLGDVDGDGTPDFAVGARGVDHDPDGAGPLAARSNSGAAFVVSGAARGSLAVGAGAPPAGVIRAIYGDAASRAAGITLAPAGDVNADGDPDLLVGSNPTSTAAEAFADVVFGGGTGTVELGAARSGYRIRNAPNEDARPNLTAVAGIGDVNGDGRDDVLVGAGGQRRVTLLYGKSDFAALSVLALGGRGAEWVTDAFFPDIGTQLAGVGDMTGDGFADVAIGGGSPTAPGDKSGFVDVLALPDPSRGGGPAEDVETVVAWGVRANLRGYVYGSTTAADYVPGVSPPPILADSGAVCPPNPDTAVGGCDPQRKSGQVYPTGFTWTPTGAALNDAGTEGVVATRGRVVLSYPSHCFTITLRDPRWTLGATEASVSVRLTQDIIEGCSAAGAPGEVAGEDTDGRVTLGTFPIADRVVRKHSVTWTTEPGSLGTEGNAALPLLFVGAELDPATITIPRSIGDLPPLDGEGDGGTRTVTVPGPAVERTVTVPAPAPAGTHRVSSKQLAATVRGAKTGKRRVKITLSRALGPNPIKAYRVWLTKGGKRVATGTLEGTELVLTVTPQRKATGAGKRRKVRTTYPRLKGSYTLRPATAGSKLPTVLVRLS